MQILLGFMVGAWGFTLLALGYALWRYVYKPWKVVRADITDIAKQLALFAQRLDQIERASAQNRVWSMSDEELANYEQQVRAMRQTRNANR